LDIADSAVGALAKSYYCSTDTKVKCGSSKADTYKKMLQQIRGITESAADGIVNEIPTLRGLFDGYAQEDDIYTRHNRLKEVIVSIIAFT
jgi:GTP1/Obg family GTP-binding protein